MNHGKEKARVLISLLGPQAKSVLNYLSKEEAAVLTANVENMTHRNPAIVSEVIQEVLVAVLDHQKEVLAVEHQADQDSVIQIEQDQDQADQLLVDQAIKIQDSNYTKSHVISVV